MKETNVENERFQCKKQDLVSSRESMSTKGIGTTVDATTIPVSSKSIKFNQNFNAKKQDLVSSRESMSTKGIGTTVDATMIPVSCKSINSNQKVTTFSPVQFKHQPREEEGGD